MYIIGLILFGMHISKRIRPRRPVGG